MQSSGDSTGRTKGRLADSSLEDWASSLENFPGEETLPPLAVSRWEFIVLSLRTAPGLVVLCICWLLLILVLLFGSILLISWGIPSWAGVANSTAVLALENDSAGWMGRRLYCSASLPCDVYSPFSADGLFFWKYETDDETIKLTPCVAGTRGRTSRRNVPLPSLPEGMAYMLLERHAYLGQRNDSRTRPLGRPDGLHSPRSGQAQGARLSREQRSSL